MHVARFPSLLVLSLLLAMVPAGQRPTGPPDELPLLRAGHVIVSRSCSRCHAVGMQAPAGDPGWETPPAFIWVARHNPAYLDGVLLHPPNGMLGVSIGAAEAPGLRAWFELLGSLPD